MTNGHPSRPPETVPPPMRGAWHRRILVGFQKIVSDVMGANLGASIADVALPMIFVLTDRGRKELADRELQLKSRMRALLILVNGERTGLRLLRKTRELAHDATSLVALYNFDLIRPLSDDDIALLDAAVEAEFDIEGESPDPHVARRRLSYDDYDRFFGAESGVSEEATPVAGMRFERLDLNWMRREAAHRGAAERSSVAAAIENQREAAANDENGTALSADGESMLMFLSDQVALAATLSAYPRILNSLARRWDNGAAFMDEINDLLMIERGDRQGFAFAILNELTDLKAFYLEHVIRVQNSI